MTLRSRIDRARFADIVLDGYLSGGIGSLPKREIDLLMLRALIEAGTSDSPQVALAKADPYLLGRECGVRASRMRSMIDELRYRHPPTEDELKAQLRDQLIKGEPHPDGASIRIQIDDGLLRDYARKLVRDAFGIVDTSFDRTVVSLSPARFLSLVLEVVGEQARAELEKQLKAKAPRGVEAPSEGRLGWLLKKAAEGGAGELGKQLLEAGQGWLRSNGPGLVQRLAELLWKVPLG